MYATLRNKKFCDQKALKEMESQSLLCDVHAHDTVSG